MQRECSHLLPVLFRPGSRPQSRCFPLSYCPLVLGLWWTDETSSTRWTLCLPPLNLQTRLGEEARKGRGAGGDHVHLPALSAFRTSSCLGRRNRTCPVRFWPSTRLLHMKQEATDRFARDTIGCCNRTERFVLLHHTMNDQRPVFSGKTVCGAFWPWPPFATHRRRTGVRGFILSQQALNLERQVARRNKEEMKNW
jgi:hypothetical protein